MLTASLFLTGCEQDNRDLESTIKVIKAGPGSPVEPLPEVYEYQKVEYTYNKDINPFVPSIITVVEAEPSEDNGIKPDFDRELEKLEAFDLDSLQYVGIFVHKGEKWLLIRDPLGLVHKVRPGNYLGKHHGLIIKAVKKQLTVQEIIPKEEGGYIYRDQILTYSGEQSENRQVIR
jgi:type IV pilus assembly protein PilP